MKSKIGLIAGLNLMVLLGWTAYCRAQFPEGSYDLLSFSLPMAFGIFMLVSVNAFGAVFSDGPELKKSFGLSLILVLLIGFGLCGWASPKA
jgi:hypothetical protein